MVDIDSILSEVEDIFQIGGLSSGLYADYATEVARKAVTQAVAELVQRYQDGELYVTEMNDEAANIIPTEEAN